MQAPSARSSGRVVNTFLIRGKLPSRINSLQHSLQFDSPGFADQSKPLAADLLDPDIAAQRGGAVALQAHRRLRTGHLGADQITDGEMVAVDPIVAADAVAAEPGADLLVGESNIIVALDRCRPAVDPD